MTHEPHKNRIKSPHPFTSSNATRAPVSSCNPWWPSTASWVPEWPRPSAAEMPYRSPENCQALCPWSSSWVKPWGEALGNRDPKWFHCVPKDMLIGFGGLLWDVDFSCPAFSVISCRCSLFAANPLCWPITRKTWTNRVPFCAYEHGHIFGSYLWNNIKFTPLFGGKNKNKQLNGSVKWRGNLQTGIMWYTGHISSYLLVSMYIHMHTYAIYIYQCDK